MEYFGFAVAVPGATGKHLVPALLSSDVQPPKVEQDAPKMVIHFDLAGREEESMVVEEAALQKGFLPEGLIHHLFGSAVGWSYRTAKGFTPQLGESSAFVAFGSQPLLLQRTAHQPYSIQCTVLGVSRDTIASAVAVADRLRLLLDRVLMRFPNLCYRMLLPLPSMCKVLLARSDVMAAAANQTVYVSNQPKEIGEVKAELCAYLPKSQPEDSFQVFFSYPHDGAFISPFVERVYDATTAHGHTAFLDQYALRNGEQIAFACMLGIVNSRILVPVITWSGLRRLAVLEAGSPCNYFLLELTLMVLLHEEHKWPVFPIFIGASDADGSDDAAFDLFTCRPPRCAAGYLLPTTYYLLPTTYYLLSSK